MIFIDLDVFIEKISFEIYEIESDQKKYKLRNDIILPKSFDIGNKLAYIRKILSTLIKQYEVCSANINIENNVGIDIIEYIKLEGIIEEVFSRCGVDVWR